MLAYTAVYGKYDRLNSHATHPLVDRWIAFTDDPLVGHPDWEVHCCPLPYEHPRTAAKWWKAHPPASSDECSVWIDGSVTVTNPDYFTMLAECLAVQPIAMFRHPDRDCIYEEAIVSRMMRKYQGQPLEEQVERYRRQGWPIHGGLWASTTFARRHTPKVLQFGAAWFAHNELLTYQDQLSLPVLLKQYGLTPEPIPGNLWSNSWFTMTGHASDL